MCIRDRPVPEPEPIPEPEPAPEFDIFDRFIGESTSKYAIWNHNLSSTTLREELDQSSFNLLEYQHLPSTGNISFDGVLIRKIVEMIETQLGGQKLYRVYFVSGNYYAFSQNFDVNEIVTSIQYDNCLLYTSPSPRDLSTSRMPSSA